MAQDPPDAGAQRPEGDRGKSTEQLRAEIEDTRGELGETVEALASKTDVRTRAREKAEELRQAAAAKKDELAAKAPRRGADGGQPGTGVEQLKSIAQENPVATAALAAFAGGVAFGRLIGRR